MSDGNINNPGFPRDEQKPGPSNALDYFQNSMTTSEVLSQFMVSQGIPLESIKDSAFKKLLEHFDPNCVIPTAKELEMDLKKTRVQKVIDSDRAGPLSLTVDFAENGKHFYLVCSIHHFENFFERKDVIFFKRMTINVSQFTFNTLRGHLRDAMNAYRYSNLQISNVVASNPDLVKLLHDPAALKQNHYICFYHYINEFVSAVLEMKVVAEGLKKLRLFVLHLKKNWELKRSFINIQILKNQDTSLPPNENNKWESTADFLKRCLELHKTFRENCASWALGHIYIPQDLFEKMHFVQCILNSCLKYSRELSEPNNSMSQVIPAIMLIRNRISMATVKCDVLPKNIRTAFVDTFQELTSGVISEKYDISTLLDPRYAYREDIYPVEVWAKIENKLMEHLVMKRFTPTEISQLGYVFTTNVDARFKLFLNELRLYKTVLQEQSPQDFENPFKFWQNNMRNQMGGLALLAREYLACPAITIDAKYFFGAGSGKFSRLCNMNRDDKFLKEYLNAASVEQEYRGRGAHESFEHDRNEHSEGQTHPSTSTQNEVQPKSTPQKIYLPVKRAQPIPIQDHVNPKRLRSSESYSFDPIIFNQNGVQSSSSTSGEPYEQIGFDFASNLMHDKINEIPGGSQSYDDNVISGEFPSPYDEERKPEVLLESVDSTVETKQVSLSTPCPSTRLIPQISIERPEKIVYKKHKIETFVETPVEEKYIKQEQPDEESETFEASRESFNINWEECDQLVEKMFEEDVKEEEQEEFYEMQNVIQRNKSMSSLLENSEISTREPTRRNRRKVDYAEERRDEEMQNHTAKTISKKRKTLERQKEAKMKALKRQKEAETNALSNHVCLTDNHETPKTLKSPRCIQCGNMDPDIITIMWTDRLIPLLIAVRQQKIHRNLAPILYKKEVSYCAEHIQEACKEIFQLFNVKQPEDILKASDLIINENVLKTAGSICGVSIMAIDVFKDYSSKFAMKFFRVECSFCSQYFAVNQMINFSKEAVRLSEWIKMGKLKVPNNWKYKGVTGARLINSLTLDVDSYVCLRHFPKNCLTTYRHLSSVERMFEGASNVNEEYQEKSEEGNMRGHVEDSREVKIEEAD